MLPSLRLIVVGFLCGFVVVYAGLRAATSLSTVRRAFPITAAEAAAAPAARSNATPSVMRVLYDAQIIASAATTAPMFAGIAIEQSPPRTEEISADDARLSMASTPELAPAPATEPDREPAPEPSPLRPSVAMIAPEKSASLLAESPPQAAPSLVPEPLLMPEPAAGEPISPQQATSGDEPSPIGAATIPQVGEAVALEAGPAAKAPPAAAAATALTAASPKTATAKPRVAAKPVRKRPRVLRRTATVSDPFAIPSAGSPNATNSWK